MGNEIWLEIERENKTLDKLGLLNQPTTPAPAGVVDSGDDEDDEDDQD